ncbi:GNAT family N-acetyltransferase [Lactococcus nasutitermitis]|uniref:GNAT family N-acetyltransferase n=1 Tax=Lactococcus nasutitermitis TaxID=1652957 RepID=A0ABV9JAI1_9LACT|nr:GNAT family N-acetyltransferase [Lactococcus nasutitermitis]
MNVYVKLAEFNVIETARLFLRPFSLDDAQDMFEYSGDWTNLEFVFPLHLSLEEVEVAIVQEFMRNPLGKWAIELKSEKKMIGSVQFTKFSEKNLSAEIGYVLNKKFWGQGLMTEVLTTLSNFSFIEFGLKRLDLLIDKENKNSIKVAEKVGFPCVEHFKAANKYTGEIREFERYRLTKKDYKNF